MIPRIVPPMLPTPPTKDTPPRITAVIASNSRLTFAAGCPEFMRAAKMMPPIEQRIPIIT